ncbi:MAG: amylo-alpha-1,6-glucosidase [Gemmataceae bacterium]|nr:amylo-alpha-1,6-glucosidase [Gemmataceae bacterium]
MDELTRTLTWTGPRVTEPDTSLTHEWLVANGLGGYASGTVCGAATRRYHGLLIAALPAPLGRTMMFNHLAERIRLRDGREVRFGAAEYADDRRLELHGVGHLREFRLEAGLPVWRYDIDGLIVEKRIVLPHLQNTVFLTYRLIHGRGPVRLKLQPSVHFRGHDAPVSGNLPRPYVLTAVEDRYDLAASPPLPHLRFHVYGHRPAFTLSGEVMPQVLYRIEASRGYDFTGDLWCPGHFKIDLAEGQDATLVASTESWETILSLKPEDALAAEHSRRERLRVQAPPRAQEGVASELVLAADQFIIRPEGRVEESARARAGGDEVRTVIAGYHWFTDWGRDTMISLEGLTLATGRQQEAGYILRTFGHYVRDGLIPNLFPEGEKEGLYHTADGTLWYFHALHRYLLASDDRFTLRQLLPTLLDIVRHHVRGTHFGIGVDPADGLLRQGAEGYQLTWMDAKVDGWVVTPRRGKAVEINALWYNALRLMEGWLLAEKRHEEAGEMATLAVRARAAFNDRFWNPATTYLFDVVDGEQGDDDACRPNQLFALSLDHPVLDESRWVPVLEAARQRLLTPVGLRSLAPGHPDYKPQYYGDLRARDAAYHQGTVWAWLIGPFVDAWLRVHPGDRAKAREFLTGFVDHLNEACAGSISEIFDAEAPYTPRGCVAQAWSVAEVLRCWVKTAEEQSGNGELRPA